MNHSIPVHEALQVAELAAPAPWEARLALLALIQLLQQIRDHAGLSCAFEDIPEAVAAMRRASQSTAAIAALDDAFEADLKAYEPCTPIPVPNDSGRIGPGCGDAP